jgi:hypothetical protein
MTEKRDPTRKGRPKKKPYQTPELITHGDVRKITQSKGGAANDGTGKPHTKAPTGPGT